MLEPLRTRDEVDGAGSSTGWSSGWRRFTRQSRRVAAQLPAGDGADRFCRRAVDGRDLHGRGRHRAAILPRLKRWALGDPAGFRRADRRLVEATVAHLIGADRGRRRGGAALRQLGRGAAGSRVPPLGDRADAADRRRGACAASRRAGHRLSARRRPHVSRLFHRDRRRRAIGLDSARAVRDRAQDAAERSVPVQGNLDPLLLVPAARRCERGGRRRSSRRFGGGPFVFNLGHGVVPETPVEHVAASRRWLHPPGAMSQTRGRAVQSRRPGFRRRGRAVPVQSVLRSGDHRPAQSAALAGGAADRAAARRRWRAQIYAQDRQCLAACSPTPRRRRGAGGGARRRIAACSSPCAIGGR